MKGPVKVVHIDKTPEGEPVRIVQFDTPGMIGDVKAAIGGKTGFVYALNYDLTGAKKLTFWARGEQGGEAVDFNLGIIGDDKPHHDSAKASLTGTTLTKSGKSTRSI